MKKPFFLFLMMVFYVVIKAQSTIPNSNFEFWTTSLINTTDSIIGWSSSNSVVISPVISLYQESNSFQGMYSANIVTAPFGFVGYSTIGILVNGDALFSYGGGGGGDNTNYLSGGGSPISVKPVSINGFYKTSTLSEGDLPFAKILVTKYNNTLNKIDTVSYSEYSFPASENYSSFTIPLSIVLPEVMPDTITCIFYSSNPNTVSQIGVWSNLYLDSVFIISNPTVVDNDVNKIKKINIYPNPNNGVFEVDNQFNSNMNLEIFNSIGEKIETDIFITNHHSMRIDISKYPEGIYYIKDMDNNSTIEKLVLIKQ